MDCDDNCCYMFNGWFAQRSLRSRGDRARGGVEGIELAKESRAKRSLRSRERRGRLGVEGIELAEESRAQRSRRSRGRKDR